MTVSTQLLSDNYLLEQVGQGNTVSFDTLFYRHYDRVYGILYRLVGNRVEAEDLLQEVFLKLHQRPPQRDEEQNVGAWLYRVATNAGYNHIRGRKRLWSRNRWLVPGADRSGQDEWSGNPAQKVEQRETQKRVREALAQLKPRDGQMLLLRQMGLSYAELAEACEVSPSSVGTLLARAGEAFRRAFEGEE
jgi:RNA polymerase sigma-70 factor (ECF subfamily)